jgi:WD40 repeat protein
MCSMQKLEVLIEENAFGDLRLVEVVADAPLAALVPAMVDELHLPRTDIFGKKLFYVLRRVPGGQVLPENTTLAACGIEQGTRLALESYVIDGSATPIMQGAVQQPYAGSSFHSDATIPDFNGKLTSSGQNTSTSLSPLKKKSNWRRRAFLAAGGVVLGVGGIGLGYGAYRSFMKMVPAQTTALHGKALVPLQPVLPTKAELLFSFHGHQQMIRAVTWSPDGTMLASGGNDAQLVTWTADGMVRHTIRHRAAVSALAWSPDSQRLVTASANQVLFLNAQMGTTLARSTQRHFATVTSLAWSAHGQQQVVSGALDRRAIVWNTTNYRTQEIFTRHTAPIDAVSWAADGQTVASSSQGGVIRVWMAANGHEVHNSYMDAQISMRALAFTPVGGQLAVGGDDGMVRLWNGLTCQQQGIKGGLNICTDTPMRLQASNKPIRVLAWSPDARFLAVGGDDGMVTVWYPAQEAKPLLTIQHTTAVHSLAWSPNGKQLVTAAGNIAMLWTLM